MICITVIDHEDDLHHLAVPWYLAIAQLEPNLLRRDSSSASVSGDARDVAQLKWTLAADDWLVHIRESCRIKEEATKPVIVHQCGRAGWSVASVWDDDEVTGAKGSSGASVSCTICAEGNCIPIASTHVVGDYRVLYTAVACLLADAVLVVLTNQLPPSGKVVALNGTCHSSVVLETSLLGSHRGVIATKLSDLDIELVGGRVAQGEGQGGCVPAGAAHVYVGMVPSVSPTYVRVVPVCSRRPNIWCCGSVSGLNRHNISGTLSTGCLVGSYWCCGAVQGKTFIVQADATNIT